jgi:hypothetical protein
MITEARTLSSEPEACSMTASAVTSPIASTVIGPIARHVSTPDFAKWSGSPDMTPVMRTTLSLDAGVRRLNRTTAPGAGDDGEIVSAGT